MQAQTKKWDFALFSAGLGQESLKISLPSIRPKRNVQSEGSFKTRIAKSVFALTGRDQEQTRSIVSKVEKLLSYLVLVSSVEDSSQFSKQCFSNSEGEIGCSYPELLGDFFIVWKKGVEAIEASVELPGDYHLTVQLGSLEQFFRRVQVNLRKNLLLTSKEQFSLDLWLSECLIQKRYPLVL